MIAHLFSMDGFGPAVLRQGSHAISRPPNAVLQNTIIVYRYFRIKPTN